MNIKKILKTSLTYEDEMASYLQDKENQRYWLEANIEEFYRDGSIDAFVSAVADVIKARGRGAITALAKDLKMDRSNLSEILHNKKRPHI